MDTVAYSTLRENLASVMEQVCRDHAPIMVTRRQADPVVMMSLADYHSLEETLYLLRSPNNARNLLESIAQAEVGDVVSVSI
jgi:antitoxin YefM